jgi:DNA-binding protein Fis
MSGGKYSPKKVYLMERRARAVELRRSRLTIAQVAAAIANEFNDSNYCNANAFKDIDCSLKQVNERLAHNAEELRELELQRYDQWLLKLQPKLDQGDPQAVAAAVKISQQQPIRVKVEQGIEQELTALIELLAGVLPSDVYRQVLEAICETSMTASVLDSSFKRGNPANGLSAERFETFP